MPTNMDEIYSHKNRTETFNQRVLYEIRVHGHRYIKIAKYPWHGVGM